MYAGEPRAAPTLIGAWNAEYCELPGPIPGGVDVDIYAGESVADPVMYMVEDALVCGREALVDVAR